MTIERIYTRQLFNQLSPPYIVCLIDLLFLHAIESYTYYPDVEDDGDREDGESVSNPIDGATLELKFISGRESLIFHAGEAHVINEILDKLSEEICPVPVEYAKNLDVSFSR